MSGRCKRLMARERVDYTDLLAELQGVINSEETEIADVPEIVVEEKFEETEFRHKLYSDEKVKYLYSMSDSLIHDKSCIFAKIISDENLGYSELYISERDTCSECEMKAYIRAGAKDFENIKKYEELFKKIGITPMLAKKIYIHNHMKSKVFGDTLTLWHKEDVWKIVSLDSKGSIKLLHNNYKVTPEGKRRFVEGFHVQNGYTYNTEINYALSKIISYSFSDHFELAQKKQSKKKTQPMQAVTIKRESRLKSWIKKIFRKRNQYSITVNGFKKVEKCGLPKNNTLCVFIWETRKGERQWQIGVYNARTKKFEVSFGETDIIVKSKKVIAWKKMTYNSFKM